MRAKGFALPPRLPVIHHTPDLELVLKFAAAAEPRQAIPSCACAETNLFADSSLLRAGLRILSCFSKHLFESCFEFQCVIYYPQLSAHPDISTAHDVSK